MSTLSLEDQALQCAADGSRLEELGELLQKPALDYSHQDAAGRTPLMLAAGRGDRDMVYVLLSAGYPWHALDVDRRTAGDYAAAGGHEAVVSQLVDHAIQAELILAAMGRQCAFASSKQKHASAAAAAAATDNASAATATEPPVAASAVNADYLSQKLVYSDDGTKLLDNDGNGVMMGWERPLMERHVAVMMHGSVHNDAQMVESAEGGGAVGLDVLNVGFGLGIIDEILQAQVPPPRTHTIIEAHPDVYAHMLQQGWDKRPGVRILFGRWQDVATETETWTTTTTADDGTTTSTTTPFQYDAIFFDTFGEYYDQLREFNLRLPTLLQPTGVYSFFNGLAATNLFFHTVYTELVRLELLRLGLTTSFTPISIDVSDDAIWEGVAGKYWQLDTYLLPTCVFDDGSSAGNDDGMEVLDVIDVADGCCGGSGNDNDNVIAGKKRKSDAKE